MLPSIRLALALTAIVALPWGAAAHDVRVGDLVIDHPWARASAGQAANGVVYFAVTNKGAEADRLIGVETGVADRAELHSNEVDAAGVMTMRELDGVEVPPGASVTFMPGGLHVMLFGLDAPLKIGMTFPATLVFERAGRVPIEIDVQGVGDIAPAHGAGS